MLSTGKKSQATMLAPCARRNSRQLGPLRRLKAHVGEQPASAGRYPEAQLGEFAADPAMAPARILPTKPAVPTIRRRAERWLGGFGSPADGNTGDMASVARDLLAGSDGYRVLGANE